MSRSWHIDPAEHSALARELISSAVAGVRSLAPLHAWGPTLVFGAILDGGAEVVWKASARQDTRAEALACRAARNRGVAVPEVLAEGEHPAVPGGGWYLMRRVPGTPWARVSGEFDDTVLEQLGEQYAKLHASVCQGAGRPIDSRRGAADSWHDWFWRLWRDRLDRLETAGVEVEALRWLGADVESRSRAGLAARPLALLHADLGDAEVIVDGSGAVTGLVDWGASVIGDPLYDLTRFVAGGPADDPRPGRYWPRLWRRYGELTGVDVASHAPLLALYQAHNAVDNAVWCLDEGVDWIDDLMSKACRLMIDAQSGLT